MGNLLEHLVVLREKINTNVHATRIFNDWEPMLLFEIKNSNESYIAHISQGIVGGVAKIKDNKPIIEKDHKVLLRATEDIMREIFSGEKSPAVAYLKGDLEVYGNDRDQSKLDVLSLVVWDI